MVIFVDENIPHARATFSPFGEVTLFSGRNLKRGDLSNCQALVVRSVTQVNQDLLHGTPVKFVATATAGTEHVNENDLAQMGITFASAPGSNADSVVAWVLSALCHHTFQKGLAFADLTVGVVGCGNVGGRLVKALGVLGARVKPVDPPLEAQNPGQTWYRLADLKDCSVISFHVPHVEGGGHPTLGMANRPFFSGLQKSPVFLNASRGEVVVEKDLLWAMDQGLVGPVALDVWQGEPAIDPVLLKRTQFGTPHVAGYATTAKFKGLQMVAHALCRHLGRPETFDWRPAFGPVAPLSLPPQMGESVEAWARRLILTVYDLERDSLALKESLAMTPKGAAVHFDRLRKEYPRRLDLDCQPLDPKGLGPEHLSTARALGMPTF